MKNIGLVLAGLFTCCLIACSKSGPDSAPKPSSAPGATARAAKVGLSLSTLNNPFFVALRGGAEAEAAAKGLELISVDAQDDPAKQIASVEDLIQKNVRVILLNPTDSAAVAGVVKQAIAAGIKVISLDRRVSGAEVSAHVASDNVAGGKLAAQLLLQKIGGKGNVVELEGLPGSSAARERGQGFHSVIDGQQGIKLVARQPADFDRAKGLSVMENILQAKKGVQGVFAHNDEMALGALKAIDAANLHDVAVVGFDATPDAVAAVRQGKLAGSVQQKPELIGKLGIDAAAQLIEGKPIDKDIPVPLDIVKQ